MDWRLTSKGEPKLLEVNPNPGWCWDGHLAKMAAIKSMSYTEMLLTILKEAEKRLESEEKLDKSIRVELKVRQN
jgi:D-alanine-D-alanine ligase